MKNNFFIIVLVVLGHVAVAQQKLVAKATVSEVDVYLNSAQLKNTTSVNLPKGLSELVIANISPSIIEKSLRVLVNSSKVKVLSSRFQKNFEYDSNKFTTTNFLRKKQDSIDLLSNRISKEKILKQTNLRAIELLDKNQTLFVGKENASILKLSEFLSFYQKKRTELLQKDGDFTLSLSKLNKRLTELKEQFFSVNDKTKKIIKTGFLVVKLNSNVAQRFNFKINYLANKSSWKPFYEIVGKSLQGPLDFRFKALVKQNTGVHWNNVRLNLIQGVSSRSMVAPVAYSWFLNQNKRKKYNMSRTSAKIKTRANFESSSNELALDMDDSEDYHSSNIAVEVNENQLNTSYTVPMEFTVKANNTDHLVNLSTEKIPVDYTYYALPKYQQQAFLIAKIKNFSKYNLVNAKAQVVFEDMYIGDTYIYPSITGGKLKITLGNDPKISIKKVKVKDKSGSRFLSNKKVKMITYDLVIRNNKRIGVKLELKDIYPISTDDAVEVELLKVSGAEKDKVKGFLTWKLNLKPDQLKKIRVSYKVKYPKDLVISNL